MVPVLDGREPSDSHAPICADAWRELVRPREVILRTGRQYLDFVTALGEALRRLTHDGLRAADHGVPITRCDKGEACLAFLAKSHVKC